MQIVCTRQNCFAEVVLTSALNLCFEPKYEKYRKSLSENFPFLVVKVSIYLNRCVFVRFAYPLHWTEEANGVNLDKTALNAFSQY